jgi:hypothetical protein
MRRWSEIFEHRTAADAGFDAGAAEEAGWTLTEVPTSIRGNVIVDGSWKAERYTPRRGLETISRPTLEQLLSELFQLERQAYLRARAVQPGVQDKRLALEAFNRAGVKFAEAVEIAKGGTGLGFQQRVSAERNAFAEFLRHALKALEATGGSPELRQALVDLRKGL